MIWGTANIKNYPDMPRRKVVEDALAVANVCDIWMQQENDPREDDDAISAALGAQWGKVGGHTNLPIYFRRDRYGCTGFDVFKMRWAGPELELVAKPRLTAQGTFIRRDRPGVSEFVLHNNHLIAGGLNGPLLPRRAAQWRSEWEETCQFLDQAKASRRTVFFGGDFNNPDPPKPTRNFEWVAGERLDRLGITKVGSVDWQVHDTGHIELNSDHDAQWVRVGLDD